jgi:flavodoxin
MKRILIYYSLEGHTRFVARRVAGHLGCDLFALETIKPYPSSGFMKFFIAGRDAMFHWKVALQQPLPDLSAYDQVLLATPVWAETVSSPLYSYVKRTDFTGKDLYLVATCSGGPTKKCFATIKRNVHDAHVKGEISFVNVSEEQWKDEEALVEFCRSIQESGS